MRKSSCFAMIAVLLSLCTVAPRAVAAKDDKHKKEEAAKHAAEKAEHERKHQEEVAKHAQHERMIHEKAAKLAAEKAEHQKNTHAAIKPPANKVEHEKKQRAESEARIAAAKKARAAKPPQKHLQTAHDAQIASALSKVVVSLHRADHDYDWQRHEAVEQLRGALHELHEPEPNTDGKFGGMTQKQSDQILRENIPALEKVRAELAANGAPAHHHAALVKVEEALSNIHSALQDR